MFLSEALSEFLIDHKARGSRPATIRWYARSLEFLLRSYLDHEVSSLNVFLVNKLTAANQDRGLSPSSVANYDRALRCFSTWLCGLGLLEKNPFDGKKRPRERWQPKQVLTQEEVSQLFQTVRSDTRFCCRNQAILSLFLGLGLRASEVARLKVLDVDWEAATLRIDGKTGNAILPLDRLTHRALRRYVTHERKSASPFLFVHLDKPLNQESLTRLMSRVGKRAGLTRTLGCHLLRHTFATLYLKNGGDTFTLQRLLRHATPAMTTRYLHYQTDDLRSKLEALSPLRGVRNR